MSLLYRARVQVNDMFSQFSRFIAPTYYHDRCERTLQMYVYIMHKREVLLSLMALLSAYILLLFIGLAGPNIDKVNAITAAEMFAQSNTNTSDIGQLLQSGPFIVTTGPLSSYSQQLTLYIGFSLKNEESSEAFHKQFDIAVQLYGLDDDYHDDSASVNHNAANDHTNIITAGNFTASLYCGGRRCDPIRVLRLSYIEYTRYRVTLAFDRLRSVNEKYGIADIAFEFRSINDSFTNLAIWVRFIFLLVTFGVTYLYMQNLYRFPPIDWSLEQRWTAAQLLLLLLCNNPFYPVQFLLGSASLPRLLEIWLHTSLQCLLMLFWLCFFHGIRQNKRTFARFYAPKLLTTGVIWFAAIYTMSWSMRSQLSDPIFDELSAFDSSIFLQLLSPAFYIAFVFYFLYLIALVLAAFTELCSLPYFDVRLKLQTFLMLFVLTISFLTILLSSASDGGKSFSSSAEAESSSTSSSTTSLSSSSSSSVLISAIPFLRLLPFAHFATSSATFLSIFSLVNIYICACAYYYRPALNQITDCQIIRDNPTISMIDDSDEEVLYGSDTEELLNISPPSSPSNMNQMIKLGKNINNNNNNNNNDNSLLWAAAIPNLIDTRTDEESD